MGRLRDPIVYGHGLCGSHGKQQYSRADALRAMQSLTDEHRAQGDLAGAARLNIYRCGLCRRWHVGQRKAA